MRNKCELADLKLGRLLNVIDEWATAAGLDDEDAATAPLPLDGDAPDTVDPRARSHERLDQVDRVGDQLLPRLLVARRADVLDGKGFVRHDGGVVDSPGMYIIGMPFLRRA